MVEIPVTVVPVHTTLFQDFQLKWAEFLNIEPVDINKPCLHEDDFMERVGRFLDFLIGYGLFKDAEAMLKDADMVNRKTFCKWFMCEIDLLKRQLHNELHPS